MKTFCIFAPHSGRWHSGCLISGIEDVYNIKKKEKTHRAMEGENFAVYTGQ
jgi:hypothetical protein